jgi:hypothetical protein
MGFSVESLNFGDRKISDQKAHRLMTDINFKEQEIEKLYEDLEMNKERKDKVKMITSLIESKEMQISRSVSILRTGNESCGYQGPIYDIKINTYDPVKLEKLQLELDIPWKDKVMNIREMFKNVKTRKNKAKAAKAAATRKRNIAAKRKTAKKKVSKK